MIDDVWAARMALKHKLEKESSVLEGNDFEDNMLAGIFENKERRMMDNYTKVKAPKKVNDHIIKYNAIIKNIFSQEQIKLLLHFCRICSYVGGNGLPDFIVIKNNKHRLLFASALPEQVVFAEMCRPAGFEAEINANISYKDVINKALQKSDLQSMEDALEEAKKSSNESFIKEAERSIARNPLFILRKIVDKIDLNLVIENMQSVEEINNAEKQEMLDYENFLKGDEELLKFGRKKDNDTLDKKSDCISNKLKVSKYKAMEILEFMGQV